MDMRTRLPANVTREKTRHDKWVYYFRVGKGPRVAAEGHLQTRAPLERARLFPNRHAQIHWQERAVAPLPRVPGDQP